MLTVEKTTSGNEGLFFANQAGRQLRSSRFEKRMMQGQLRYHRPIQNSGFLVIEVGNRFIGFIILKERFIRSHDFAVLF